MESYWEEERREVLESVAAALEGTPEAACQVACAGLLRHLASIPPADAPSHRRTPPSPIAQNSLQVGGAFRLPPMLAREDSMPGKERMRETLAGSPTLEHISRAMAEGWRLVGLEWEREVATAVPEQPAAWVEDVPYGLQVSDDCCRLVENPAETEIIVLALDRIVDDLPLSRVAEELNNRGYRTRTGANWTAPALFDLLPRMIQVGPRLFLSEEWTARRQKLPRATP